MFRALQICYEQRSSREVERRKEKAAMLPNAGIVWHRPSPNGAFHKYTAALRKGVNLEDNTDTRGTLTLKSCSIHFPLTNSIKIEVEKYAVQIIPSYIVVSSLQQGGSRDQPAGGKTSSRGGGGGHVDATSSDAIKCVTQQVYFALAPRSKSAAPSGSSPDRRMPEGTYLFRARHEKERDDWVRRLLGSTRQSDEETWPFGRAHTTSDVKGDDLTSEGGEGTSLPAAFSKGNHQHQRRRGNSTKHRTAGALAGERPLDIPDTLSEGFASDSGDESGGVRSDDSSAGFAGVPTLVVERPSQPQTPDLSDGDEEASAAWDDLCHDSDLLLKAWQGTVKTLRQRRVAGKAPVSHFAASVLKGLSTADGPIDVMTIPALTLPSSVGEAICPHKADGIPVVVLGAELDDCNANVVVNGRDLVITRTHSQHELLIPCSSIETVLPFTQEVEVDEEPAAAGSAKTLVKSGKDSSSQAEVDRGQSNERDPNTAAIPKTPPSGDAVEVHGLLISLKGLSSFASGRVGGITNNALSVSLLIHDRSKRDLLSSQIRQACCEAASSRHGRRALSDCPPSLIFCSGALLAQDQKLFPLCQRRNAEIRLRALRTALIGASTGVVGPHSAAVLGGV